jgi:hypothetical protein
VCKALTSRLQTQISELIDPNQSGFIAGRSISENFVYATEMVQCCHKRRTAAFTLKLDFAKAFDSINWDSLDAILRVRGFPEKWCTWMQAIFDTSRSAVVLNGIPGRWICCRRGLRQGDPLSPYLFLLVTDVLQRMIQHNEVLEHPIWDGMPPVVLQYADDTLILFRADVAATKRLRSILDMFAAAMGLVINFHKGTLIAMHVDNDTVAAVRDALGCSLESFPQNNLGLPLLLREAKPHGLRSSDRKSRPLPIGVAGDSALARRARCPHQCCPGCLAHLCHGGAAPSVDGCQSSRRVVPLLPLGCDRAGFGRAVPGGLGRSLSSKR